MKKIIITQTKTQQPNLQIFTIWSDEIKGRIDPLKIKRALSNFLDTEF